MWTRRWWAVLFRVKRKQREPRLSISLYRNSLKFPFRFKVSFQPVIINFFHLCLSLLWQKWPVPGWESDVHSRTKMRQFSWSDWTFAYKMSPTCKLRKKKTVKKLARLKVPCIHDSASLLGASLCVHLSVCYSISQSHLSMNLCFLPRMSPSSQVSMGGIRPHEAVSRSSSRESSKREIVGKVKVMSRLSSMRGQRSKVA